MARYSTPRWFQMKQKTFHQDLHRIKAYSNSEIKNTFQGRRSQGCDPPSLPVYGGFHPFYSQKCDLQGQFQGFAPPLPVFQNSRCRPPVFQSFLWICILYEIIAFRAQNPPARNLSRFVQKRTAVETCALILQCVLSHLGCTHIAGTSRYLSKVTKKF